MLSLSALTTMLPACFYFLPGPKISVQMVLSEAGENIPLCEVVDSDIERYLCKKNPY